MRDPILKIFERRRRRVTARRCWRPARAWVRTTGKPSSSRMARLHPPGNPVILSDLEVGMTGAEDEPVRMDPDQNMGKLYPFSLNEKLGKIAESSPWYSEGSASPWGRAIIPLEMVSVLAEYTSHKANFLVKQPSIGLFADLEIRMIEGAVRGPGLPAAARGRGPVGEQADGIPAGCRTRILDGAGQRLKAEMLLNHAVMKESFPGYDAARQDG